MKVLLRNPRRQLEVPGPMREAACGRCGGPTPSDVGAFCRLVERTAR